MVGNGFYHTPRTPKTMSFLFFLFFIQLPSDDCFFLIFPPKKDPPKKATRGAFLADLKKKNSHG
jgi:hypothetical protein